MLDRSCRVAARGTKGGKEKRLRTGKRWTLVCSLMLVFVYKRDVFISVDSLTVWQVLLYVSTVAASYLPSHLVDYVSIFSFLFSLSMFTTRYAS